MQCISKWCKGERIPRVFFSPARLPRLTHSVERFHLSSRQPYWCAKTIQWELNFLCKRFLLFQQICIGAAHVSENALHVFNIKPKLSQCSKYALIRIRATHVRGYEDFLSLNTSLAWSFSLKIFRLSGVNLSLNFLHWREEKQNELDKRTETLRAGKIFLSGGSRGRVGGIRTPLNRDL